MEGDQRLTMAGPALSRAPDSKPASRPLLSTLEAAAAAMRSRCADSAGFLPPAARQAAPARPRTPETRPLFTLMPVAIVALISRLAS